MSIDFERRSTAGDSIQQSGFIHGMPSRVGISAGDRPLPMVERREENSEGSSSSSSIGRNSDVSGGEDCGEYEVQSSFKGPLDSMDALEEVLPIKRGLSNFYNGKSQSFTSLADASSACSIKDFAKPENPYTRKRKNILAHSSLWDKNHNLPPRDNGSGISEKPANSNRSTLALGLTVSSTKSNNNSEDCHSMSLSPSRCLPPLHPHGKRLPSNEVRSLSPQCNSPWRSFSLSDLQCAAAATSNT